MTSGSGPFVVVQTAEAFYQTLHEYTHLPWWCVIVSSTVLLRSVVTLPFAVHQHRLLAKMELLMPTLKEYQEAVKHNVIAKCRRENLPLEVANKRMKKEARKVARELYHQEGCSPYKLAFLPWVQLPLWITLSFSLRNMCGAFPGRSPEPDVLASFTSEGALWFSNLTLPDPYYILPVILATTNLLNIEIHALKRKSPTRTQRIMSNVFRTLSLGMGYVGSLMPSAMTLYWAVSSSFGLMQNLMFRVPRVRRVLGVPRTASESKRPFRELGEIVHEKARTFIKLQHKDR